MIDGGALAVTLGGLFFWGLAWQAIRKKRVLAGRGEVKDSKSFSYYRIVLAYILVGLSLVIGGIYLFHRIYGWQGPLWVWLSILALLLLVFQASRLRSVFLTSLKKPFQKKEKAQIQPNAYHWALAAVAMLARVRGMDNETLAGKAGGGLQVKAARRKLRRDWDIQDGEDLETIIHWLMEQGHRHEFHDVIQRIGRMDAEGLKNYLAEVEEGKYGLDSPEEREEEGHRVAMIEENKYNVRYLSFLAWDYLRLIDLCRQGRQAEWLDEKDAWTHILSAAQVLQARYESWEDMGRHFLYAREFWSIVEMKKDGAMYQTAFNQLLEKPDSPWNILDWNLSLYGKIE